MPRDPSKKKASQAKWREKNRDHEAAYQAQYRITNNAERRAYDTAYRRAHGIQPRNPRVTNAPKRTKASSQGSPLSYCKGTYTRKPRYSGPTLCWEPGAIERPFIIDEHGPAMPGDSQEVGRPTRSGSDKLTSKLFQLIEEQLTPKDNNPCPHTTSPAFK